MQTVASKPAQGLTSADVKQKLQDIQDNAVAPILMRYGRPNFFGNIALTVLLLAFAIGGFAQSSQGIQRVSKA